MVEYKFLTPWLALNQDNYERFANSGIDERTDILKKILTGNILSMAKGLGYWVEEPIEVLIKLNPVKINYKNRKMIGFKGGFMTNFMIPNHLGLGKSVARGFGTVKKVNGGFV